MSRRGTPLLLAALLGACAPDPEPGGTPASAPWFVEEAAERGLVFEHLSGHEERYRMPEIMGGGAALFDADDDGDLDAFLVQSGPLPPREDAGPAAQNRLFLNDGAGRFEDRSAGSGAERTGYGMGVACGDADGDGDTDLLVTAVGPDVLLLNQGGARFRAAGPQSGTADAGWSTSAAFLDADRDGQLDLFVCRYLEWSPEAELLCMDSLGRPDYCSPKNYKTPARDLYYRNAGAGRFEDHSRASGVWSEPGTGLGVSIGDLDGDGWLDVFVANDGMPNHLWRNREGAGFENVAMRMGCGVDANGLPKAGMGVVLADLDDDLDLDVLVCNLRGESDSFYRNEGRFFSDRTAAARLGALSKPFTRFGLALQDFDQDGRLDVYQANGKVERAAGAPTGGDDPYAEPNLLLRGLDDGGFEECLPRGGTASLLVATSRAAAAGDVDGDGAIDLLVVNKDGRAHLLLNRVAGRGAGLLLDLRERSGAPALGAEVQLEIGGRRRRRDVCAAGSYLASNDPRVHLGLGTDTGVDGVVVRWVDGQRERFGPFAAGGGVHTLRRGSGVSER